MFYIHPWEIDPDQPRLPGSLRSRFRHYQNLRTTERKLERLLESFAFGTMEESLQAATAQSSRHTPCAVRRVEIDVEPRADGTRSVPATFFEPPPNRR
jgi:hypothetical protein